MPIEKGIALEDEASSKKLVLKLYPGGLGERLAFAAGYGRKYDWRKVLEPTDATAQCNNTGHKLTKTTKCYICGLLIPDKAELTDSSDELWAECEHILPLTEGRWLLDIYISKRILTEPWYMKARQLEYDQAHRVCNQAKSNLSFILSGNPATVSDDAIRTILGEVVERANNNIKKGDRRPMMRSIAGMNIEERLAEIRKRVQQLVDHINSDRLRKPENAGMSVLLQTALMVDPESLSDPVRMIHDEWYKNAPAQRLQYEQDLTAFAKKFTDQYPQLSSPELIADHLTRLLPRGQNQDILNEMVAYIRSVAIKDVIGVVKLIFDAKKDHPLKEKAGEERIDIDNVHMLNLVMYGILQTIATRTENRAKAAQRLTCLIIQRMTQLVEMPGGLDARGHPLPQVKPTVLDVFGPPPKMPDFCKSVFSEEARDTRELLREYEPAYERASPAELAQGEKAIEDTIAEQGLPDGIRTLHSRVFGVQPSPEEISRAIGYARRAMRVFLDAFPERYADAQHIAARSYIEHPGVALQFLRYGVKPDDALDILERAMSVYAKGAGRRKTHRRRRARKTLRKRVRA